MYTGKMFGIAVLTSFLVSLVVCGVFSFVLPRFLPGISFAPREEKVEVPTVTRMTLEEARLVLQNKDLLLMEEEKKSYPNVPVGSIVSQDPLPGFEVAKGSLVKVVVSSGGHDVVVPNLEGIPRAQARLQLESIKLVLGEMKSEMHESIPKDAVIRTDPKAGTKVPAGTVVDVIVSIGEVLVEVPSVFRMSAGAARSKLEKAGFQVTIKYSTNIDYEFGVVIGQDPRACKQLRKGSTVTILVNAEAR
jgi:beta-lactam-binding protein with PASTA domain